MTEAESHGVIQRSERSGFAPTLAPTPTPTPPETPPPPPTPPRPNAPR
jgi:hypothetical protein